jgi:predicted DNA-binding helix-hairpin-helix protein
VHVKVIPGASQELIQKLGLLADRVSVNIELAHIPKSDASSTDKKRDAILTPMGEIQKLKEANQRNGVCSNRPPCLRRRGNRRR